MKNTCHKNEISTPVEVMKLFWVSPTYHDYYLFGKITERQ